MNYLIKECTKEDLSVLREFSIKTFSDAFAKQNSAQNIKAYLNLAYAPDKLYAELTNGSCNFYFLYADEKLAGYVKINEAKVQTDIHDPESLEIERIYVANEFQGKGCGGMLMNKAIEEAAKRKKKYLWLGVWENNTKALRFYQKKGFYPISKHSFFLGQEEQTDLILRKDLECNL